MRLPSHFERLGHICLGGIPQCEGCYNADIFLYKPWKSECFFFNLNYHKCLSQLFPLDMNTYVMGLRSLYIF